MSFNSIKVQLEHHIKDAFNQNHRRFNSIKVQLEHITKVENTIRIDVSIP